MSKVFDIRTGKERPPSIGYVARKRACLERSLSTGKHCDCVVCMDKMAMAKQLLIMSRKMCVDYHNDTGNVIYAGDWFEIVVTAANSLQKTVYPKT